MLYKANVIICFGNPRTYLTNRLFQGQNLIFWSSSMFFAV